MPSPETVRAVTAEMRMRARCHSNAADIIEGSVRIDKALDRLEAAVERERRAKEVTTNGKDADLGMEYNGAEGHEDDTIASIVAEMRDTWTDTPPGILSDLADRIEAAAKREISEAQNSAASQAALDRTAKDAMEYYAQALKQKQSSPGNTAAMREALEKCAELGDQIDNWLGSDEATVWNCRNERSAAHNIMLTARAALAAPARNCDRFADVLRASEAYEATRTDLPFEEWLFSTEKGKETDNV